MNKSEILELLRTEDEKKLEELWRSADAVRKENVGEEVHLRGLLEISNYCARSCFYCGLRAENRAVSRYRMEEEEIFECARSGASFGYGSVVLQAGEDAGLTFESVGRIVRRIKAETPLAVTLSLGERSPEELVAWKEAGADRYLLRFETSNKALFDRIHPPLPGRSSDRMALLRKLKRLGYEVGSGIMIGIPGQSYEDLAEDILAFRYLDLDMIGVGPFIPHPATPLGLAEPAENQAPGGEAMTYRVLALARLACPKANIPSTTALATLNLAKGRELGLMRGANIVMPNLTPRKYRALYEIYPSKACIDETAEECRTCMSGRIRSIGRALGVGRGDSPNRAAG